MKEVADMTKLTSLHLTRREMAALCLALPDKLVQLLKETDMNWQDKHVQENLSVLQKMIAASPNDWATYIDNVVVDQLAAWLPDDETSFSKAVQQWETAMHLW